MAWPIVIFSSCAYATRRNVPCKLAPSSLDKQVAIEDKKSGAVHPRGSIALDLAPARYHRCAAVSTSTPRRLRPSVMEP